jgi:hypothetical protein
MKINRVGGISVSGVRDSNLKSRPLSLERGWVARRLLVLGPSGLSYSALGLLLTLRSLVLYAAPY